MDLGQALQVSPLIKTARWSLLLVGIWWGHKRYGQLKMKADEVRAYEARMKPIWDAEKAAEKAKHSRQEMLYLARETGTKVPEHDHQMIHNDLIKEGCELCK